MNSTSKNSLSSCGDCSVAREQQLAGNDLLVCSCFDVRESRVREAVALGAESLDDVIQGCGAGGGCGGCHVRIRRVLQGMPAKCGSGRFDLCGGCGSIGALCGCAVEGESLAIA